jgi:curved DNA-binding protein CbpA
MAGLTGAAIGAGVGAVAGGMGTKSSSSGQSGIMLSDPSDFENYIAGAGGNKGLTQKNLETLDWWVRDYGGNAGDINASTEAQRGLADLLKQYSQTGGLPGQSDIDTSNNISARLFGGQREQLNQSFADQTTDANRRAALMGRSLNDPILAAKLAQEQTRQSRVLDANQGSFAQQMAMNLPMQRLGFAGQRADVLGGLASQAMKNRLTLASLGDSALNTERNWRLSTGTRFNNSESTQGGGLGGAISGALGGAGTGASLAGLFGGGGPSLGGMSGGISMPNFGQNWAAPTLSGVDMGGNMTSGTGYGNFMNYQGGPRTLSLGVR